MNSDVLQFQCNACQTVLTVPAHMAGVSGPCPVCGQTITSPRATEPSVPLFTTPPISPAPSTALAPSFPESLSGASAPPLAAPFPPSNLGLNPGLSPSAPPGLIAGKPSLNPGLSPVMPLANSITQHLSPINQGITPPTSLDKGFSNLPTKAVQSPATPPQGATDFPSAPWQQPGLGQTLLSNLPQPPPLSGTSVFPTSAASGLQNPSTPPPQHEATGSNLLGSAPPSPWSSLPSKPEGSTATTTPPTNEGMGFFGNRPTTGAPTHSSLIPGSPSLPSQAPTTQSATEHGFGFPVNAPPLESGNSSKAASSLLTREISSPPPASPKAAASQSSTEAEESSLPSVAPTPPPILPAAKISGSLKKPSRSSNVFMRVLAAVFLIGFLIAAGWMFRAPLKQLVSRFSKPVAEPVHVVLPEPDPNYKAEDDEKVPVKEEAPKTPDTESTVATTNIPPNLTDNEAPPLRAEVPTTQELAALRSQPPAPALTEVPAQTPAIPSDKTDTPTAGKATPIKIETTEEGKPAAEALVKFLKSKSLTERLQYTLGANSMKPLMERYYQAQPDGPLHIDAIGLVRLDRKPQMGNGAHALFGVESRDWEYPVPVMLEEGKNGFQVDWLSFVEFKDRLLEKFFESYQDGAARFHVGITRTHYFDDKVPNSDNKDAFTISPAPPNPYQTTVFVEKDSQLGRDLRDRIPWGSQVWAIVDLEWVKLGNQQWVQLVGLPQLNWYSVPTEPKAGGKSSELPNEIQRAVPVGR